MLRRMGKKSKIAEKILLYFPEHDIYIELFFGAGGMFFNKPKARYNIVNDFDNDVFNLYITAKKKTGTLVTEVKDMPVSESLFKYWLKNKEDEQVLKAVRFLFLSNFSLYGTGATLAVHPANNTKTILLQDIKPTAKLLDNTTILNCDFRDVLRKISAKSLRDKNRAFVYADPPYLSTCNNYNTPNWTFNDSADLIELLVDSKYRFAISEFDNADIVKLARQYDLNVNIIGERRAIKTRRTEILITNY